MRFIRLLCICAVGIAGCYGAPADTSAGLGGSSTSSSTGQSTSGSSCANSVEELCASCEACCQVVDHDANGCPTAISCDGPYHCQGGASTGSPACADLGQPCASDSACCSSYCVNGSCAAQGDATTGSPACAPVGQPCSVDSDCCGDLCVNQTCAQSGGSTTSGCGCQTDTDCENFYPGSHCQNGGCYITETDVGTISTGCGSGGTTSTSTTGTTGQGSSTPLVLSFDRAGVTFTRAPGRFELGQGEALGTDWVSARTPWLALDRNGNGRIDDGSELFGSLTRLPDGRLAPNGFAALAALDTNHDGRIDARDPAFAKLLLWSDENQDRSSQPLELVALARAGVIGIELANSTQTRCDSRANCEQEQSRFIYRDVRGQRSTGTVIDVHLAHRAAQKLKLASVEEK